MYTRNILVVGGGTMGSGIAQVAAVSGFQVTLTDVSASQLERAQALIAQSVAKLEAKGVLNRDQCYAAQNIRYRLSLDEIVEADLVIEAVYEDIDVKLGLFSQFDQIAPQEAILGSNTSSISITKLAAVTSRPAQVIGMHFMNPVPLMRLVEVVAGMDTSQKTVDEIMEVCQAMGKEPVLVNDSPGFISNRLICPMINEAIYALQENVGSAQAIDAVMKLGMNHPMGPLALADLIGLDVVLAVMEILHRDLGEDKYRPAYLLRKMVAAGRLGRKSGRGFYIYN